MADEAGAGCVDRSNSLYGYTVISNVAASQAGSCDRLAAYLTATGTGKAFNFAFFTRSGNDFTTVDGTRQTMTTDDGTSCHEKSAPGDFTAFSVSSGDYLGCYYERLQEISTSGAGMWDVSGDSTDASSVTFNEHSSWQDALTADITAAGGGVAPTGAIHGALLGSLGGPI